MLDFTCIALNKKKLYIYKLYKDCYFYDTFEQLYIYTNFSVQEYVGKAFK